MSFVVIKSKGPNEIKVKTEKTGVDWSGSVSGVDIKCRPGQHPIADIRLFGLIDVKATSVFRMRNPHTGHMEVVESIVFKNGATFNF